MSKFKTLVKTDMKIFFNENELAETVLIEGKEYLGILSEVTFDSKYMYLKNISGLHQKGVVLSIKTEDFPKGFEFESGDTLKMNKLKYSVIKALNKINLYEIHLERISE